MTTNSNLIDGRRTSIITSFDPNPEEENKDSSLLNGSPISDSPQISLPVINILLQSLPSTSNVNKKVEPISRAYDSQGTDFEPETNKAAMLFSTTTGRRNSDSDAPSSPILPPKHRRHRHKKPDVIINIPKASSELASLPSREDVTKGIGSCIYSQSKPDYSNTNSPLTPLQTSKILPTASFISMESKAPVLNDPNNNNNNTNDQNVVIDNPRLREDIKVILSYFNKINVDFHYFKVSDAEEQLLDALQTHSTQIPVIVSVMLDFRARLKPRHFPRFRDVLIRLMLREKYERFIDLYFVLKPDDIKLFAPKAIHYLIEKKKIKEKGKEENHVKIVSILAIYTRFDSERAAIGTIFREDCLSSKLCLEYANIIWLEQLENLGDSILRQLKKVKHPYTICLKRQAVIDKLKKDIHHFDRLPEDNKEQSIKAELIRNARRFKQFASPILEEIYFKMKIPSQFSDLLQMRREKIIQFLTLSKEEQTGTLADESRIRTCEMIFLRILQPRLFEISDKNPEYYDVIESLTKIINCLGKETPFREDALSDPAHAELNSLYKEYIERHRLFLDQHSNQKNT